MARTHGFSRTPTYQAWASMIARCTRKSSIGYPDYGGRGITVCDRWRKFENFLADLGVRPPGLTLERDDVNGNYEPNNCRWATDEEQKRNRRDNRHFVIDGVKKVMTDWAKEHGLKQPTVWRRLAKGETIEQALRPVWKCYVINGESKTLTEWANCYGVKPATVRTRLSKGDSVERALRPVSSESFRRVQKCRSE